jgi:alkylation response protein AidB-like acyl-CoA dehydrogenase
MIELTPEQKMLRESVRTLLAKEVTPALLERMDRHGEYPYALYDQWVRAGWIGAAFPEEYGGAGGSIVDLAIIMEELAYASYDVCSAYAVVVYTAMTLAKCGTVAQKQAWLPRIFDGTIRMSVSISEPQAGSDVSAMRTRARRDGDHWVLDGQKVWATAAGADRNVLQVFAITDPSVPPRKGMSVFLVPNTTPGVECRKLEMLGRRGTGTYEIFLTGVRVPGDQLLGEANRGWDYLLACLQGERLTTAAGYVGSSRKVYDLALAYAKEREQFGRPIGEHQAIAHLLADMETEVEAASLLMWNAAAKIARGEDALREVTMAKLFGSETYVRASNTGMQIMGAAGYSMEYEMQRHFRDARSTTVGAGSSQMQRNLLAALRGLKVR